MAIFLFEGYGVGSQEIYSEAFVFTADVSDHFNICGSVDRITLEMTRGMIQTLTSRKLLRVPGKLLIRSACHAVHRDFHIFLGNSDHNVSWIAGVPVFSLFQMPPYSISQFTLRSVPSSKTMVAKAFLCPGSGKHPTAKWCIFHHRDRAFQSRASYSFRAAATAAPSFD